MNQTLDAKTLLIHALPAVALLLLLAPYAAGQGGTGRVPPNAGPAMRPRPRPTPSIRRPPERDPKPTTQRSAPEIELVRVPGGTFLMGSPNTEVGRSRDEGPQHEVTVPSFYLGKYEVTQAQWRAVMGDNPSRIKGDDRPVEGVSWEMAVEFCKRLSRLTGKEYRLPTEAEWEYAARAGTQTAFSFQGTLPSSQANCDARGQLTRVGTFPPNAFGLHDMHGNVWEWTADNFHEGYVGAPTDGSAWFIGGSIERVVRGGSSDSAVVMCRSAYRDKEPPDSARRGVGLRVAADLSIRDRTKEALDNE